MSGSVGSVGGGLPATLQRPRPGPAQATKLPVLGWWEPGVFIINLCIASQSGLGGSIVWRMEQMGPAEWEPLSSEPSPACGSCAVGRRCPSVCALHPSSISSPPFPSLLCHPGGQPRCLPGLVDWRWLRSQLRLSPGLAAALLPLWLRMLVPACLQGLPVSGGTAGASWGLRTCLC